MKVPGGDWNKAGNHLFSKYTEFSKKLFFTHITRYEILFFEKSCLHTNLHTNSVPIKMKFSTYALLGYSGVLGAGRGIFSPYVMENSFFEKILKG